MNITPAKMAILSKYKGEITIEESTEKTDIVIRVPLFRTEADKVIQKLEADDKCDICDRYCPEGLTDGLCEVCADLPVNKIDEGKLHELILKKTLGL